MACRRRRSAGWLRLALSRKARPSPSEASKMSRGHSKWDILQTLEQREDCPSPVATTMEGSLGSVSVRIPNAPPCDNELARLRFLRKANLDKQNDHCRCAI